MIKIICIALLSGICGALITDLRIHTIGALHIEQSGYGSRIYVSIIDDYGRKAKGPYVRLKVIRETVSDEEHEKYILKEKE